MGCQHVRVINPKNLGIPVWMGITCFRRSNHNITTVAGVYCIPVTADVVCCVVDGELFRRIDGVVNNPNRISFVVCKQGRVVAVKVLPKKSAEEVNTKF